MRKTNEIPKDERSPRYYGAVAKSCKQTSATNPYTSRDSRHKEFLSGYEYGVLVEDVK